MINKEIIKFLNKKYCFHKVYRCYGIKRYRYQELAARIYYIAFFLFFTLIYSQNFDQTRTIRQVLDVFRPVGIVLILIFIKYIFFQSHSLSTLFLHATIVLITCGRALWGYGLDISVVIAVAFIICSEYVDYRRLFRLFILFFSFWIIYASFVGMVTGTYFTHRYEYRGQTTFEILGRNSNTMGLYLFILFALINVCFDFNHYKWVKYVLGGAFTLYDFFIVNCLTSIGGILTIIILFEILHSHCFSVSVNKKIITSTVIISAIGMVSFFVIPYILDVYRWFPEDGIIYNLTSNRLHSGDCVLKVYSPWTMWGQYFDHDFVTELTGNAYHDSFILAHLVDDGILWTALLCGGIYSLIYKSIRDERYDLLCLITALLVYSTYETAVLYFWNMPIWFVILPISQQLDGTKDAL